MKWISRPERLSMSLDNNASDTQEWWDGSTNKAVPDALVNTDRGAWIMRAAPILVPRPLLWRCFANAPTTTPHPHNARFPLTATVHRLL